MRVLLLSLLLLNVGCGSSSDSSGATQNNGCPAGVTTTFLDQTLQGKIEGVDWTMASGKAFGDSFDNTIDNLRMYNESSSDICTDFIIGETLVLLYLPKGTGTYQLSNSRTITLASNSNNYVATSGIIEITSADSSQVVGKIAACFDGDNYVNGSFTLTYCP
jgi:hypothetical protein